MYYKDLVMPSTKRGVIDTFLGYNHNHRIAEGEFYEMGNLCVDEYPALSPRKPRTCMLSLKENDWEETDIIFFGHIDGQVSETKVIYSSGRTATNEREEIAVSYNVNTLLISHTELRIIFYEDGEYHSEMIVESDESMEESVVMREGVTEYEVIITATPKTPSSYTEEEISNSVTDITIRVHNWNIQGMLLKDGKLAYMVGSRLYYDGQEYDFRGFLTEEKNYREKQQLLSFGAYILIFPLGLYLNTNTTEYGYLGADYEAGKYENEVTLTLSDAGGNEIVATNTKPSNPEDGSYWLDTSGEKAALYKWSDSLDMWVGVASTYIKISMEFTEVSELPFPQMFQEGDALHMNTGIEEIDNGSIIVKQGNQEDVGGNVTGGYVVVKGILNTQIKKEVDKEKPITFRRKIPNMNYVCVSHNRVWGCYHGVNDKKDFVNEIYASKLGDPKNWYCYEGAATDSYALSLGDDGEFTGAFTFQGYPMFFKENVVYKIYGAYPAAYQLYTYNCRGVQKGSSRSIAVVNEYLMYKSVQDICVFDGSTPAGVSAALGNKKYCDASAGACMGKYYISMKDENGEGELFVFDIEKGIWHREDHLYLEEFAYNNNGELYGRSQLSVYGFGNAKSKFGQELEKTEEKVMWYAETGDIGYEYLEKKYINAIQMRAYIAPESYIDVYIKIEGEEWKKIRTIRGEGETTVYRMPVRMKRSDGYRIKLEGLGPCRIYSLVKELETGSDK